MEYEKWQAMFTEIIRVTKMRIAVSEKEMKGWTWTVFQTNPFEVILRSLSAEEILYEDRVEK